MKTRAITAVFFTIVMLASVFLGSYVFSIFYLLLSTLAVTEFYRIVSKKEIKPQLAFGVIISVFIFIAFALRHFLYFDLKYLLLIIPCVLSLFVLELYKKAEMPFSNIATTLIGIVYVTMPFSFFQGLGFIQSWNIYSYHLPLSFLLMLWANDTGAYIFGLNFGKTKLFERHSPKKTWEGFFGGILATLVVAFLLSLFLREYSFLTLSGMALIISIVGTAGDLVESMLKRSLNVKDSGNLLPGHGGLLDRFDGLLLSAPLVYIYLSFLVG